MAGYAYTWRFRVVYEDGPTDGTLYDLTGLASTPGPISTRLEYIPEKTQRMTPGKKLIERRFGVRIGVTLKFELSVMADEASLVAVFNALNDDTATVYLSLNGGTTERAVVLDSYGWEPLGDKAPVGVAIEMKVKTVDVVDVVPSIIGTGGVTQW